MLRITTAITATTAIIAVVVTIAITVIAIIIKVDSREAIRITKKTRHLR